MATLEKYIVIHYQYDNHDISCVRTETTIEDQVQTDIFFRAKEVAASLGYQNTKKAIQDHVAAKYKNVIS